MWLSGLRLVIVGVICCGDMLMVVLLSGDVLCVCVFFCFWKFLMFFFVMYFSLVDCCVLIIGGVSGIGVGFVEYFVCQGVCVVFFDIDDVGVWQVLDGLVDVLYVLVYLCCDFIDVVVLQVVIVVVCECIGLIVVLVNNVVNDVCYVLVDIDVVGFECNVVVNLCYQIFVIQVVLLDMQVLGGGLIICLGFIGWMKKNGGYLLYVMVKVVVCGFVNGMVCELGQQYICINGLIFGWVIIEKQCVFWLDVEGEVEICCVQCMLGYFMVEDFVCMVLFFVVDDSCMCIGQDFIVDGGWV